MKCAKQIMISLRTLRNLGVLRVAFWNAKDAKKRGERKDEEYNKVIC